MSPALVDPSEIQGLLSLQMKLEIEAMSITLAVNDRGPAHNGHDI